MKKRIIAVISVLALMFALMLSITAFAQNENEKQLESSSTYEFTIIEDEEVPLANGMMEAGTYSFVLYVGAIAAVLAIGMMSRKTILKKDAISEKDMEAASEYMDELFK